MTTYRILCEYHQFFLAPIGVDLILDPSQPAELIQLTEDGLGLIVLTGIASGPIEVELDTAPATATDWEEQGVTSMSITESLFITAPTIHDAGAPGPVVTPTVPGLHRVTVLARGRDRHYDAHLSPDSKPAEHYRIVIASAHL